MSISEIVFRWIFRVCVTLLAAYGLTELFTTPDVAFNIVRFTVFSIVISLIELILLF